MKYLSLFSGIGGFELGIQRAYIDAECIGFSEIDKYATAIYNSHFNHHEYGDITKIDADKLPNFDLLVGGFPCQSFSIAGKRRGFADTRGTMFFEIARILRAKQPRLFLLENVKGLLSHDNGKTFGTIIATLDELGYDVQWQVLNSKNHGVPQNRERVFIIGNLRGTPRPKVFPFGESERNSYASDEEGASQPTPAITTQGGTNGRGMFVERVVQAVLTPDRLEKRKNGRRFKDEGEPSFTLTAQDKHGVYNGASIRRLTPIECARLQGFPDEWHKDIVSDSQAYKCYGNAVTVNVIRDIASFLL